MEWVTTFKSYANRSAIGFEQHWPHALLKVRTMLLLVVALVMVLLLLLLLLLLLVLTSLSSQTAGSTFPAFSEVSGGPTFGALEYIRIPPERAA